MTHPRMLLQGSDIAYGIGLHPKPERAFASWSPTRQMLAPRLNSSALHIPGTALCLRGTYFRQLAGSSCYRASILDYIISIHFLRDTEDVLRSQGGRAHFSPGILRSTGEAHAYLGTADQTPRGDASLYG